MTSTVPDVTSEQKTEDELWTAYMVALARYQENWRLYQEAWHDTVTSSRPRDYDAMDQIRGLVGASREVERQAHRAWKRVAYPLHDMPLSDDEE